MKNLIFKLIGILIMSGVLLSSCGSDDDDTMPSIGETCGNGEPVQLNLIMDGETIETDSMNLALLSSSFLGFADSTTVLDLGWKINGQTWSLYLFFDDNMLFEEGESYDVEETEMNVMINGPSRLVTGGTLSVNTYDYVVQNNARANTHFEATFVGQYQRYVGIGVVDTFDMNFDICLHGAVL